MSEIENEVPTEDPGYDSVPRDLLHEANQRTAAVQAQLARMESHAQDGWERYYELRNQHGRLREAAAVLLTLKDGNRGVAYYEQRDAAWQALRDSLAGAE